MIAKLARLVDAHDAAIPQGWCSIDEAFKAALQLWKAIRVGLAFPNGQDTPSLTPQRGDAATIAGGVSSDLLSPVFRVGPWKSAPAPA